ncbi:Putative multidrug export ATP-binding/permease protein [Roseimaritima multifibrata]|uniref:Multidrug export ATP-binding/permease protein n=1 Tax=Roseimaritima multifibrata TaxID=1930274 RepID=A0A517MN63_9BACT|nr:ABC transporter ATP-binding protein [Roseimaritima multifibrata]QDS96319.1 Putative multidrug export ATP-binding/permease protein [Roseimaritima multifibrata]
MPNTQPSRTRFREYRQQIRQRKSSPSSPHSSEPATKMVGGKERHARKLGNRQRGFFELVGAFWFLVRGYRLSIVQAILLMALSVVLSLIPPAGTKLAIDCVLTDPPRPLPDFLLQLPLPESKMGLLFAIAVTVTVLTLIATMIRLGGRWLATKAVNRTQVSIRNQVFEHAVRLPLHKVYDLKSGGVASLIREDAGGVSDLIFSMLYNPARAIIQFVGSLIILMWVDWKLMLGGLALLPAVWITHRTWIARVRPLFRDIRRQRQHIDSTATETFGGIRVVRTFARARSEAARFVREGDFMVRQQLFTWWWTRIIEIIWEVLIPLASTGLLLYGGYQIINGQLTLGDLMMFLVYLTMLLDPLATLAGSAVTFQNNLAGLDRILDVMEMEQELPTNPGAIAVERASVQGTLLLDQVSFRYPDTESVVLSNIQLEIPAGQTVALVGRSGAGKTTLTNLVARFYDPTEGTIRLDGRDLKDIQLDSYRQLLGMVEQDVFLFDGTIGENIAYARRGADPQDIQAAAVAAAADEFIVRLPKGYETLIGERGVKLSGGQRQRIAIARAILADPKILILDEATSNLDSESERLIQSSLEHLLTDRTALVIAHRLSTIRNADKIVVLEDGRIVESGTHDELIAKGSKYSQMVELQTEFQP